MPSLSHVNNLFLKGGKSQLELVMGVVLECKSITDWPLSCVAFLCCREKAIELLPSAGTR
jgi:hypothetical protein